jgi:hypothetical protein
MSRRMPLRRLAARARAPLTLLVIGLASRLVGLWRPCLSDDEATYCVVARELLAGRVLYRDVVDHKPPLIYLTYAATQAIGGPVGGMRLLHLLTALVVFATALLLGRVARLRATMRAGDQGPGVSVSEGEGEGGVDGERRRAGPRDRGPFLAALLYIVFTTTLLDFDAQAANCELYMLLPLTASVLLYLRVATGGLRRAPLAEAGALAGVGALVGVAMLYKYQAAVQLPLYALHLAWWQRRRPRRLVAGLGALLAGWLAVLAGAAVLMLGRGALPAAWFWFRFNFAYIKQGFGPGELAARAAVRVSYGVAPALFLWVLGLAAVRAAWRGRTAAGDHGRIGVERLVAAWLLVSALAVMAGGRFFGHYFHQITAPLAVLAAPAAARLWLSRRRLVLAAMGAPAALFFALGLCHGPVMAAAGRPDPDYGAMAAFIDAHSRPDDGLVIWGNAPVLYFEARRPLGSRFVFSNYLTGLSPATRTESDPGADASANVVAGSWAMFEADLARRRPRLFVDTAPGNLAAYGKFPTARYPRLQAILDRDYRPIGEVAGARVFVRSAAGTSARTAARPAP